MANTHQLKDAQVEALQWDGSDVNAMIVLCGASCVKFDGTVSEVLVKLNSAKDEYTHAQQDWWVVKTGVGTFEILNEVAFLAKYEVIP